MHLQISVCKSQMRLAVVRLQADGNVKIHRSLARLFKIVQHEAAIHVAGCHLRVAVERAREIVHRLTLSSVACCEITSNQRKIFIVLDDGLVLRHQILRFLVASQVVQIVGQVDDTFAIVRKFFENRCAAFCSFSVIPFQGQIALAFAADLRVLVHLALRTIQPVFCQLGIVRFERRCRASSYDQRAAGISLERLFVACLRLRKLSLRCVQVAESEIRRVVFRMCGDGPREICLREFCISPVARQITERRKCSSIVVINLQHLGECCPGSFFLAKLPLQAGVIQQ